MNLNLTKYQLEIEITECVKEADKHPLEAEKKENLELLKGMHQEKSKESCVNV